MLELRIMQGSHAVPLFDLPSHLGRQRAAQEVGDTIEGLIAYLDDLDGDPDLDACGAGEDLGTDHVATHKMGFDDPQGDDCAEIDDEDCCAGRDDTGTAHAASHKIGFDAHQGGLECDDAESTHDREAVDEREPDDGI